MERDLESMILAHYVQNFGAPSRVRDVSEDAGKLRIAEWICPTRRGEKFVYATIGQSNTTVPGKSGDHRIEMMVTLSARSDSAALHLASAAFIIVTGGAMLDVSHTVTFDNPIIEGEEYYSFVLSPTYVPSIPSLVLKTLHVQFLQATPIYPEEARFIGEHGAREFHLLCVRHGVDLTLVDRGAVV